MDALFVSLHRKSLLAEVCTSGRSGLADWLRRAGSLLGVCGDGTSGAVENKQREADDSMLYNNAMN